MPDGSRPSGKNRLWRCRAALKRAVNGDEVSDCSQTETGDVAAAMPCRVTGQRPVPAAGVAQHHKATKGGELLEGLRAARHRPGR